MIFIFGFFILVYFQEMNNLMKNFLEKVRKIIIKSLFQEFPTQFQTIYHPDTPPLNNNYIKNIETKEQLNSHFSWFDCLRMRLVNPLDYNIIIMCIYVCVFVTFSWSRVYFFFLCSHYMKYVSMIINNMLFVSIRSRFVHYSMLNVLCHHNVNSGLLRVFFSLTHISTRLLNVLRLCCRLFGAKNMSQIHKKAAKTYNIASLISIQ